MLCAYPFARTIKVESVHWLQPTLLIVYPYKWTPVDSLFVNMFYSVVETLYWSVDGENEGRWQIHEIEIPELFSVPSD